VGKTINQLLRNEIECVLVANAYLFAWSSTNMPGIDPNFMYHKLARLF